MENRENKFKTISDGQFIKCSPNYVRIGFSNDRIRIEFGNADKKEPDGKQTPLSAVSLDFDAEIVNGLSAYLSEAYESYSKKKETEVTDSAVNEGG